MESFRSFRKSPDLLDLTAYSRSLACLPETPYDRIKPMEKGGEFLKERAEQFLDGAQYHFSKRNWGLAAFNLEQACQLFLKYSLFKELGDFPKIHSLNELLKELAKVYPSKRKKIEEIRKDKASVIGDLEQASITSRYLPIKFNRFQVENMLKFTKNLISFLKNL